MIDPHGFAEVNFDGLVGSTHHFLNTAPGNLASGAERGAPSNPRLACRQGLDKMRLLHKLGVPQAMLPPHPRPNLDLLASLGFTGNATAILRRASEEAPELLAAACSSSFMWAANAATVSPSPDTHDGRIHFTPANLASSLHRAQETAWTTRTLRSIFPDGPHFVVHNALPSSRDLSDEGAANHTRLTSGHGQPGVHVFTYGIGHNDASGAGPRRFTPRQTLTASAAVARRHGLRPQTVVFAQQSPIAIDAGAFHHDVVGVGHLNTVIQHATAWEGQHWVIDEIQRKLSDAGCGKLTVCEVNGSDMPLDHAVANYLFNSQIVTPSAGRPVFISPAECERDAKARGLLERLCGLPAATSPFGAVRYTDLGESMRNGGGPACLRLRVPMSAPERRAARIPWYTPERDAALHEWTSRHYRDTLSRPDLTDPELLTENLAGMFALADTLDLKASEWHRALEAFADRWAG